MADLKLRIRLNEGRTGAPLEKMGDVTRQFERFLDSLAGDLGVESKRNAWLAVNFGNGSVRFDAAYQDEVPENVARKFNDCLAFVTDYDPDYEGTNGLVSEATLLEYGKIGACLDPDEVVSLGLFSIDEPRKRPKWRRIEYRRISRVRAAMETPLSSFGSVQGSLHSLFKEVASPYFTLRELSTGQLIRCSYSAELYPSVIRALEERTAVVHASGYLQYDRTKRAVGEMQVERIDKIEPLTDGEFSALFGLVS